jgi:hypothetical protein
LTTLCFPDITGATLGAYGLATFAPGAYVAGGVPFGLVQYADARTIDFNGFLMCQLLDETQEVNQYTFKYIPSSDVVQIFLNGTELANGIPINITDPVLFHAVWNRTTTLG